MDGCRSRLSRRELVQGLGAVGVSAAGLVLGTGCGPLPGQAPLSAKVFRIGFLAGGLGGGGIEAFQQGLRELGYVEGQNLNIEYRFTDGSQDQFQLLAADLVSLKVDVIVAVARGALAAKNATTTIPVVMTGMNDPVGSGIVASLRRPGGNVTGLSLMSAQLGGKRLQLLKEVIPSASRIAVLWNNATPALMVTIIREIEAAARILGVHLIPLPVQQPEDLENAFESATMEHADALITVADTITATHRTRIVQLAATSHLPAVYDLRGFADVGGLMSYGADIRYNFHRVAYYVDRILKGANPADLPIEQPMRFEFVVNMKTAQALSITFPHEILLQVTEVIQ
jgi:putative tryptophan/tyrosine transport system substrate-binding protein